MRAFIAISRKQVAETRWALLLSALALFALGWLFVFVALKFEMRMKAEDPARNLRGMAVMRAIAGSEMDFSSLAIEVMLWSHPIILLPIIVWAISRGSAAPAGEVEKGTIDLTLSRPVARASYLGAQVVVTLMGIVVLCGALVIGNRVGSLFNTVETPPRLLGLVKPALNLAALGLAVYGPTLLFSSFDSVRWRPNLTASVLTLASFIIVVVVNLPTMENWKWAERLSIFKAYQPVEVALKGATLATNLFALSTLGLSTILVAFLVFQRRDIPSNS